MKNKKLIINNIYIFFIRLKKNSNNSQFDIIYFLKKKIKLNNKGDCSFLVLIFTMR